MVLETWVMPLAAAASGGGRSGDLPGLGSLRLLRLLRLTRMAGLVRFFPELMTLVKGMVRAMESVGFVLAFLVIITYGAAIVFTSQLSVPPGEGSPSEEESGEDPTAAQMFGDLGSSMMTLFTNGVLGDNLAQTLQAIKDESLWLMWLFVLFMLISGVTLLNMLIGVLCEVVSAVAAAEREEAAISLVKQTLLVMLKRLDTDGSQTLTREELFAVIHDPASLQVLLDLKVDVPYLLEFQNMLFEGHSNEIPIRAIMDLILSSRGDRAATVQDIIDASSFTHFLFTKEMCQHEARMAELFQRAPRAETK
mmetsp:Transcript_53975/g.167080  ORF Transcript_53975/g.167080 Transcript_53975/m.167080 type:complete len:308 (+) Transcript_53975:1-924(+)